MIRHRCAACGQPINRIDALFEPSDGTLCAACLARLGPAGPVRHELILNQAFESMPSWAVLPGRERRTTGKPR